MSQTTENTKVTEVKEVAKKEVVKFDYKGFAESIEKAFADDKRVEVIADSNLELGPRNTCIAEYRFIHFYTPGQTKAVKKDLFQLYIDKKDAKFLVTTKVADFLDAGLNTLPVEKTVKGEKRIIHIRVTCDHKDIEAVAKKLISAFEKRTAATPAKAEKKAEPKAEKKAPAEKKPAAKKQTTAKKTTAKKVVNK